MIAEFYIPSETRRRVVAFCVDLYQQQQTDTTVTTQDDWLTRLAQDVFRQCNLRKPFTVYNTSYISTSGPSLSYSTQMKQYPNDTVPYHTAVARIVADIIASWFSMPTSFDNELRAHFIRVLIKYMGPSCLLLEETWDVYEAAPQWLLNDNYRKGSKYRTVRFRAEMMNEFDEELSRLPSADTSSHSFRLLHSLGSSYQAYLVASKVRR